MICVFSLGSRIDSPEVFTLLWWLTGKWVFCDEALNIGNHRERRRSRSTRVKVRTKDRFSRLTREKPEKPIILFTVNKSRSDKLLVNRGRFVSGSTSGKYSSGYDSRRKNSTVPGKGWLYRRIDSDLTPIWLPFSNLALSGIRLLFHFKTPC